MGLNYNFFFKLSIFFFLSPLAVPILNQTIPIIAERNDAAMIPTFAICLYSSSLKARSEINIDIQPGKEENSHRSLPDRHATPANPGFSVDQVFELHIERLRVLIRDQ